MFTLRELTIILHDYRKELLLEQVSASRCFKLECLDTLEKKIRKAAAQKSNLKSARFDSKKT